MRLFVALSIPGSIAQELMLWQGGVPGARWQSREQLHSVGQFGNKQPHTLWAAARKNEMLEHLARKVDTAIRRVGQPQDAHKFTPHVTLARLRNPELDKVREWLTDHALSTSTEFTVEAFCLYSSKLTSDGSIYRVEQEYPLKGYDDGEIDD